MLHNNIAVEIFDCFVYNQPKGIRHNLARDYCALAYRADTECRYSYSDKSINASRGSLVFVPDGLSYDTSSDRGRIYVIHFNLLNHSYTEIDVLSEKISDELLKLFEECIRDWETKKPGYIYKVTSVFYKMLESLAKSDAVSPEIKVQHAKKCREYINTNFAMQELSITDVAKWANISEVYLRRIFKNDYGMSPKEYLTKRRIKYAKYLINTGYFSHKEIAQRCGFGDVKYFRYAFKKHTGKTINEYKEYYKEKISKSRE